MQVCCYHHQEYNRRNLPRNAIENKVITIIFILYSRLQYAQTTNVTIIILEHIDILQIHITILFAFIIPLVYLFMRHE
jgi:hypothetical protein